jgi:hypothetical protein
MDKQKMVIIAKKVEALAIGFIGVWFFSYGTSYFKERFIYNVPRILIPVFNFFGNIGLAIGMLILGAVLIVYGFSKWKSVAKNKILYWIFAVTALAVGVTLANINFNKGKSDKYMEELDKKREAQIEELRNSGDLNFKKPEVDAYIAEFNALYKRYEGIANQENINQDTINEYENRLDSWRLKSVDIFAKLNNDEKYELSRYIAKLSFQWYDLRTKYLENLKE